MYIRHCNFNNPIKEKWFLEDDKIILFAKCDLCKKDLAVIIDAKTKNTISKLFAGVDKVLKLKKNFKKRLIYKDFEVKGLKGTGFIFGLNIEIHDCKGRINKIRQRAKDFFGNQNLVREIEL